MSMTGWLSWVNTTYPYCLDLDLDKCMTLGCYTSVAGSSVEENTRLELLVESSIFVLTSCHIGMMMMVSAVDRTLFGLMPGRWSVSLAGKHRAVLDAH